MRLARVFSAGIAAACLIYAFPAQAQEADKKVAGGGITVKGWQGKADPSKQGLTINDSKFAPEGKGFRMTTGPAGMYWSAANNAKGDFSVKATFTEAKQVNDHPHPFGVFIGGSALDTDAPNALYCAAYRNGNYIVRGFSGGQPFRVVAKPAAHDAVKKGDPAVEVVNEVGFVVKGDSVSCVVNGTAVWTGTKADVTGAGKLPSLDGIVGIRTGHNSDAVVTNFALGK
jgi:hypothetical protein